MRILVLLFLFPLCSHSQPIIDDGGDNWKGKVSEALVKLSKYDQASHAIISKSCDRISFWLGDFSSNVVTKEKERTILISAKEMQYGSVNDLIAILLHESVHLWVIQHGVVLGYEDEEILCYSLELECLKRIPDAEHWLLQHAETQIQKYQKNKTHQ
jgi:hypothetical protein